MFVMDRKLGMVIGSDARWELMMLEEFNPYELWTDYGHREYYGGPISPYRAQMKHLKYLPISMCNFTVVAIPLSM